MKYSVAMIVEPAKIPKVLSQYIEQSDRYKLVGVFSNCAVAITALSNMSPQIVVIYKHMAFWSTDRFIQAAEQRGMTFQYVLVGDEANDPITLSGHESRISANINCADLSEDRVLYALRQASDDWDAYNNFLQASDGKPLDPYSLNGSLCELARGVAPEDVSDPEWEKKLCVKGDHAWLLWGVPIDKDAYVERAAFGNVLKSINYYLLRSGGGVSAMAWKDVLLCFVDGSNTKQFSLQYAHPMQNVAANISQLLDKAGCCRFQFFVEDRPIALKHFCTHCGKMDNLQRYGFFLESPSLLWPTRQEKMAQSVDPEVAAQYILSIAASMQESDRVLLHETFSQLTEMLYQTMSFPFFSHVWNSLVLEHTRIAQNYNMPPGDAVLKISPLDYDRLGPAMEGMERAFLELCEKVNQRYSDLNPILHKAVLYLKEHLAEKISLNDVADNSHASVSYVSRLFKSETGQTFTEFLNQLRVEKSKELLRTQAPVQQISEQVGFDSPKYFSRVFKKMVGLSPKQFQRTPVQDEEDAV